MFWKFFDWLMKPRGSRASEGVTTGAEPENAETGAKDETGATAVEYGLMLAGIAAVIFATVALLGPRLVPGFQTVINNIP